MLFLMIDPFSLLEFIIDIPNSISLFLSREAETQEENLILKIFIF